ncbi:MAG: lipid-A-disaccharide synthase [Bacteroidetes bacterium]|nr:lipid-A-disaccharide synthase [Bacteroidota bacterium]
MKYYIIAGEASGDMHGANLIKELKSLDSDATFRCWGGDLMKAEGKDLIKHYRDLAFMGFWEVIKNINTIYGNMKFCFRDIISFDPDTVILIDYPGFNLRIAKKAKQAGYKVVYYISPQVWAWRAGRVKQIKKYVDKMIVILPFEKEFYSKWNYEVDYVGHPLLDVINNDDIAMANQENSKTAGNLIIAVLPGSRKQEMGIILPIMLSVKKHFESYQFIVGGAPSVDPQFYKDIIVRYESNNSGEGIGFVQDQTYDLLKKADIALVTSGTATLETALFGVPQIVCYKGSFISYIIGRSLVDVKYISLVNLILDTRLVPELIQSDLNEENIKYQLDLLITGESDKDDMISGYNRLTQLLGGRGASRKAATAINQFLN